MFGFLLLISSVLTVPIQSQESSLKNEVRPAFDAVSIRQIEAYQRTSSAGSSSFLFAPHKSCVYADDKVTCQLSLEELVREAYQRKRYEVNGPKWLGEDLYVFQGVLATKTSQEDARLMMQRALEERFVLKFHVESKPIKAYVLLAAPDGQRLIPAEAPDHRKLVAVKGFPALSVSSSRGRFAAVAIGLDMLGIWVEHGAGLDRPVLNGTGLDGLYKFDLHWNPPEDDANDMGMVGALKSQAGLILSKQGVLVDVLVIDQVTRTPTEN
jgi:uncharacterized protein (TIGR03435 family)